MALPVHAGISFRRQERMELPLAAWGGMEDAARKRFATLTRGGAMGEMRVAV